MPKLTEMDIDGIVAGGKEQGPLPPSAQFVTASVKNFFAFVTLLRRRVAPVDMHCPSDSRLESEDIPKFMLGAGGFRDWSRGPDNPRLSKPAVPPPPTV